MGFMTASEAAKKWNISQRRVQILCSKIELMGFLNSAKTGRFPKPQKNPLTKDLNLIKKVIKMNVIDLFCGRGGFSKGFNQAGFNIVYGIDNWKDATVTYKHNFPSAAISNEDITNICGNDILKATGLSANEIDVIIGGPPCQGFSLSGKKNAG